MNNDNHQTRKNSIYQHLENLIRSDRQMKIEHQNLQNEISRMKNQIVMQNNLVDLFLSQEELLLTILDLKFNFLLVNSAFCSFFNKNAEYFTGKEFFNVFHNKKIKPIFMEVIDNGVTYKAQNEKFYFNKKLIRNEFYGDWTLNPYLNMEGDVIGVVFTLQNTTKRVMDKILFERTNEELIQSKKMSNLGLVTSMVMHDLRNYLSVIQVAVYNINRKLDNAAVKNHLEMIEKKVVESDQTISNLLTYSGIKLPLMKKVNIIELLEESIDSAKIMFASKTTLVDIDFSGDFQNIILIDPSQIKIVFNNILINAFQSIDKSESKIQISLSTVDHSMILKITDNGCGIKKSDLDKVFQPFYTNKVRGVGLGLYLCRKIVDLHQGTISIESQLSKNTTIILELPYREGPSE